MKNRSVFRVKNTSHMMLPGYICSLTGHWTVLSKLGSLTGHWTVLSKLSSLTGHWTVLSKTRTLQYTVYKQSKLVRLRCSSCGDIIDTSLQTFIVFIN